MLTIKETFYAEYEVKKSTFFSFLTPYDNFESLKNELHEKHPKANHIVWAYRILNEYEQVVENQSDDGEPKGTSGPPALNVLRGSEIINCGVLIVRYFGGIKLGTGGLVRAYSASTQEVIKASKLVKYEKLCLITFDVSYQLLQRFEHFFSTNDFLPHAKDFGADGANISMKMTNEQVGKFKEFIKTFPDITFTIT